MLTGLDLAIIGAFLAYAIASGLRSREAASRDLTEYFLAGRSLPGWKAGISMAATQFAADTPLLVTGMIATAGVFAVWRLSIYALAFLLMGFVLGAAWRRAGVLTDAELAELRYGARAGAALRAVKAVYFGLVFNCTVMAIVLLAATRIAEPFLRWHDWLPAGALAPVESLVAGIGVPLTTAPGADVWARSADNMVSLVAIVAVTAFYSTTGGLRAVVNTDLLQFAIAMVAALAYLAVLVGEAGGLAALPERIAALGAAGGLARPADEVLAFTPGEGVGWAAMGAIAVQWVAQMNADGTGYLAQRTMACRSDADARVAAVIFVAAQNLLRTLLFIGIGLALLVLYPPPAGDPSDLAYLAAREVTFVEGIARYLPSGLRGLMLAGLLAALASTLDTHLNWGSSYLTNDLYRRFVCSAWLRRDPSPRELVWVARAGNGVILLIAGVVLFHLGSIQTAWKTSLLLGAGMGGVLLLRWFWWRITAAGELSAIAASSLLAPLLLWQVDNEGLRLILMAVLATGAAVAVSLAFGPEAPARLDAFYARVRPPGFWGQVASRAGDDPRAGPRALARGLGYAFAAAFGVFCLIAGLGSWLFGSPPPGWIPSRGAWIAANLVLGSAALAVVLPRAVRGR